MKSLYGILNVYDEGDIVAGVSDDVPAAWTLWYVKPKSNTIIYGEAP